MEAHIVEWLNLTVRWIHMITGIAWIGASFYFIFLENNLNRIQKLRPELAGNLWAIHGGGFYYLEKYKLAPDPVPEHLHWFKWEAYFTWISGVALLAIVYYYNASFYMLDPGVADISANTAIGIGIATMVLGWLIYDLMCKSALVNKGWLFAIIGFVLVTALAYGLSQFLSARAAYIHVGAMLGTLMAANVFFVIIPAQKAMVKAALNGEDFDPLPGQKALTRSIHNNYMTLPVLFIMISNHFPSTFGNSNSWLILAGLILVGAAVRHWFNLRGKGQKNYWLLPASIIILLALVYLTRPIALPVSADASNVTALTDASAFELIDIHCSSCHSVNPSSTMFAAAPKGVVFDTLADIKANPSLIKAQTVNSKIMPLGNSTNMQDSERQLLGNWLDQLASPQAAQQP
ncbi:MAG: urate hydroxylase PuuD [Xanthomonadales bacterium]|nr:urate hydroxylase PuuD [Xanthomonadales bacterium]